MFKPGDKVVKTIHVGDGTSETSEATVHSILGNVVFLENSGAPGEPETGITYRLETGKEIENFFPPMRSEIALKPEEKIAETKPFVAPKKRAAKK